MAIESKNLLVAIKAYSRGNALPLDASEVYESLGEATTYASSPTAYAGQTIKAKLEDGKYHTYTLQPSDAGYTLEEVGAISPTDLKQYVIVGTRPGSGQEQGVIYIDNNEGYIWNGSAWVKVFSDVSPVEDRVDAIESELDTIYENPTFTGTVTIEGDEVATQEWVNTLIGNLNNGIPGIVDDGDNPLPSTGYKAGQMWRVAAEGTYAGQDCEIGDLIICIKNHASGASNADFMVVQANIDGAVTGADSSTDGHIVIFNGSTGKIIKDSNVTIASLNDAISKAHTHSNKAVLDSYTKTEEELLEAAATDAASKVSALESSIEEELATKANSADVYSKSDIDSKLQTINQNLNTKVDAATVDSKIEEAKTEILEDAATAVDAKIGDMGESTTVVDFVTKAIGSGGTDVAEQIAQAKQEAINISKQYTDTALTITEF